MTGSRDTGPPKFQQIWVETARNIYAELDENEFVRYVMPDGTAVWAKSVVVSIIAAAGGDLHLLAVFGTTENGCRVRDEYRDCADDYPGELARLVPKIIRIAGAQSYRRETQVGIRFPRTQFPSA